MSAESVDSISNEGCYLLDEMKELIDDNDKNDCDNIASQLLLDNYDNNATQTNQSKGRLEFPYNNDKSNKYDTDSHDNTTENIQYQQQQYPGFIFSDHPSPSPSPHIQTKFPGAINIAQSTTNKQVFDDLVIDASDRDQYIPKLSMSSSDQPTSHQKIKPHKQRKRHQTPKPKSNTKKQRRHKYKPSQNKKNKPKLKRMFTNTKADFLSERICTTIKEKQKPNSMPLKTKKLGPRDIDKSTGTWSPIELSAAERGKLNANGSFLLERTRWRHTAISDSSRKISIDRKKGPRDYKHSSSSNWTPYVVPRQPSRSKCKPRPRAHRLTIHRLPSKHAVHRDIYLKSGTISISPTFSAEIADIIREIQAKLRAILDNRTAHVMRLESANEECCQQCIGVEKMEQLKRHCEPLKRVEIVLSVYYKLIHVIDKSNWNEININEIFERNNYGHQQLFNDFNHITQHHIVPDNVAIRNNAKCYNIAVNLCAHFAKKYKCKYMNAVNIRECIAFSRHYRERTNDQREQNLYFQNKNKDSNANEITFQQRCDSIHCYFLHSTVQFGTEWYQITVAEEDELEKSYQHKPFVEVKKNDQQLPESQIEAVAKNVYIGKKQDDLWWSKVSPKEDAKQSQDEIYRILVESCGVFRWQNPHGFAAEKNREIGHYKPKFKNIKEEALQNDYEALSKDNWNQTLRKGQIFYESWARQKVRTQNKGLFDDQITGHKQTWNQGIDITMQEIITLKLYTDFDKLQFVLKKSFRFETVNDILNGKNGEDDKTKQDLEHRLRNFWHWRGGLLIVLNKFGTKLNGTNNIVLYHGVNTKMIIKPSQTFAFSGPLSTSSSYHVARTFATGKGMVLQITSHFPRLNYCNAFDASVISDYPEEQEWLIGFMYVRLLEVRTRKLIDNLASFQNLTRTIPLSSWVRQIFFAIHLFKEQIFSMSEHLERIQAQFLKVNRKQCCNVQQIAKYKNQCGHFADWDMSNMCGPLCKMAHNKSETFKMINLTDGENRKQKITAVLWDKFNEFRLTPNVKQRIKFDSISKHLKRFFMEESGDKDINTKEKRWSICFGEIVTVYPNVKEIHFINEYKFTDKVLRNLIRQIEKKNNSIQKIVFLYYDYKVTEINEENNKPSNYNIFTDPDGLDINLKYKLEQKGWKIKHNKNGNTGYKIMIYLDS